MRNSTPRQCGGSIANRHNRKPRSVSVLTASLPLVSKTQTEGADYGKTEVYASGAFRSSDSEHA